MTASAVSVEWDESVVAEGDEIAASFSELFVIVYFLFLLIFFCVNYFVFIFYKYTQVIISVCCEITFRSYVRVLETTWENWKPHFIKTKNELF